MTADAVNVALKIFIKKFEDQIQLMVVLLHVTQADDIGVLQLLEERDLAERRARDALVLALEFDLFERRDLAGLLVRRDVHLTEGALAELLATLPLAERLGSVHLDRAKERLHRGRQDGRAEQQCG